MKISVVIPTKDRPRDLHELLLTLLDQDIPPFEVVIIDDSTTPWNEKRLRPLISRLATIGCGTKYITGSGDGLTAARNLGVRLSSGEAVLFLDDDILLDKNALYAMSKFLENNADALGAQLNIISRQKNHNGSSSARVWNIVNRIFMLTSYEPNKLLVRRSGFSTFPHPLTKVITAQRLSGCCCCYRRAVFDEFQFDENLKKWANMEDTDFSYRLYKNYPASLYAVPYARVFHKGSSDARLPEKTRIYMSTTYWFYVFFKDVFRGSLLNLIAFLWTLMGNLFVNVGRLMIKRKPRRDWWTLIYLVGSSARALRNLKDIRMQKLQFFDRNFGRQG